MTLTGRTEVHRLPKRGSHDPATIHAILDAGLLAQPFVIPTLYGREGDRLYLHGSAASRMLKTLDRGVPACVNVALVDGLVLARSAFHHSINYRSVVAFGTARLIEDPGRKTAALRIISEHVMAGRWEHVRAPYDQELKATGVLAFDMEEASAKIRTGPPLDDEEDYNLPVWAGVLPLQTTAGTPLPDARLANGTPVPEHVVRYRAAGVGKGVDARD